MSDRRRTYYIGGSEDMGNWALSLGTTSSGNTVILKNILNLTSNETFLFGSTTSSLSNNIYLDTCITYVTKNGNLIIGSGQIGYNTIYKPIYYTTDLAVGSTLKGNDDYIGYDESDGSTYELSSYSFIRQNNLKIFEFYRDGGYSVLTNYGPMWYDDVTDSFYAPAAIVESEKIWNNGEFYTYYHIVNYKLYELDANSVILGTVYESNNYINCSLVTGGKAYLYNSSDSDTTDVFNLSTKTIEDNISVPYDELHGILI